MEDIEEMVILQVRRKRGWGNEGREKKRHLS